MGIKHRGWRAAKAEKFGDVITCDHVIPDFTDRGEDRLDKRTAFVIYDIGTKFIACYPLRDKTAEQAEIAMAHFLGPQAIGLLYSDGSGEIDAAARNLSVPHDDSPPRVHERNAIIERRNESIIGGTRTLLECAGLPACFWPIAARFFACARNFEVRDGDSAWHRRHTRGHLPPKDLIPFGSLVGFRPDKKRKEWKSHGKFAPNAVPGIFLGWHMQYGHVFPRRVPCCVSQRMQTT